MDVNLIKVSECRGVYEEELRVEERDKKFILKKFQLVLEASEASAIAPLSPTFGQFGLNCQEFCQQFNERSKIYIKGTPLRVCVFVFSEKRFFFIIQGISLNVMFSHFILNKQSRRNRWIRLLDFFLLYQVISEGGYFSNLKSMNSLVGVLKSMKVKKVVI